MDVGRLAIWLVLLVALFVPIERLLELRPVKIWRKQVGVDLAWYFINGLVPSAILAIPLSPFPGSVTGRAESLGFLFHGCGVVVLGQIAAGIPGYDFVDVLGASRHAF